MKKCLFIMAILFCGNLPNFAQKARIDSILANLGEIRKNDSVYYNFSEPIIDHFRSVNIDSSDYYIKEFIKISKKHNWVGGEIAFLAQLAFNANLKGNQFLSIEYNYKALALAEKNKRQELIPQIQLVLGESYFQLKQFDKAKSLLNAALKNAKLLKKEYEITASLTDLGNVELEQNNYLNAENYFRQALKSLKYDSSFLTFGIIQQNLAVALARQFKLAESLTFFNKSINIYKNEKQFYQLSNVNIDLADFYFGQKKYQKSIEAAQIANDLAQKSKSIDIISKANFWLYKNFEVLNQKEKALEYFETHITLKDSLNKEDFQKRINSMQFEYENIQKNIKITEQNNNILEKENENLQLQKNKNLILGGMALALILVGFLFWNRYQLRKINGNLELMVQKRTAEITEANLNLLRKNQQISEALFKGQTIERKRVASELHDNLSSLLSAVKMSMQAIKPTNLNDSEKKILEGVKDMTTMAYNEVRNISHNILPDDLEEKGLVQTLQKIIDKINLSGNLKINLKSNILEKIDSKIEFNLYSIILEIINNTIKHAQATESNILIEVNNKILNLKISDNGIGMEQIAADGLGLENIKDRIKAINGKFDIDSEKNIGTKINISVPI